MRNELGLNHKIPFPHAKNQYLIFFSSLTSIKNHRELKLLIDLAGAMHFDGTALHMNSQLF